MRRIILTFTLFAATSCATIKSSGPWFVPVDTYPPGARVIYRGNNAGTTPCEVRITKESSQMTIRKDGYHDQLIELGRVGNGYEVLFGTLLFGPFELLLDAASNSWTSINGAPVALELTANDQRAPETWER